MTASSWVTTFIECDHSGCNETIELAGDASEVRMQIVSCGWTNTLEQGMPRDYCSRHWPTDG